MKWILAQLNRPFFLRESHTFLIKGFFEWKFAHFTRTWIARWIFTHFCSHHEAHGITKGLPAYFFKMDTTSQLIGGSFALRSSLLLSHSHQEDTFEKKLAALHAMLCHHCWAGRYISRLRWREVADESRMNPIWGCTADWEWTQEAGIHLAAMTSHM